MGVFIITIVGATIVALLGLWSARVASAESKAMKMKQAQPQVQSGEARDKSIDNRNQDNPAAMAMAGPTGPSAPTNTNPVR